MDHHGAKGTTTTKKSEYELRRLERIQRNRQVMQELGLPTTAVTNSGSRDASKSSKSKSAVSKRSIPVRQSERLIKVPKQDYTEKPIWTLRKRGGRERTDEASSYSGDSADEDEDDNESNKRKPQSSRRVKPSQEKVDELMATAEDVLIEEYHPSTKSKSCVDIDAHLEELKTIWIGKIFRPPAGSGAMKETVMHHIGRENPVFNKYSGLQEFRNAVILFVNVGGRDYENVFFKEVRDGVVSVTFDWFASPKVKSDSRAIKKLLTATVDRKDFGVFLFLRFEGEPYLSCGPCLILESNMDARPMRFRLRIQHTMALLERSRELFEQLLSGERDEEDE